MLIPENPPRQRRSPRQGGMERTSVRIEPRSRGGFLPCQDTGREIQTPCRPDAREVFERALGKTAVPSGQSQAPASVPRVL